LSLALFRDEIAQPANFDGVADHLIADHKGWRAAYAEFLGQLAIVLEYAFGGAEFMSARSHPASGPMRSARAVTAFRRCCSSER
jgi:hypothetical protein